MRFHFKKTADYGRRGPRYFVSEEVQVMEHGTDVRDLRNKNWAWGQFSRQPDGHVYAQFHFQIRWPSNPEQWWGYVLSRHMEGDKKAAVDWLNYLLNNPPWYFTQTKGADSPPNPEVRKE